MSASAKEGNTKKPEEAAGSGGGQPRNSQGQFAPRKKGEDSQKRTAGEENSGAAAEAADGAGKEQAAAVAEVRGAEAKGNEPLTGGGNVPKPAAEVVVTTSDEVTMSTLLALITSQQKDVAVALAKIKELEETSEAARVAKEDAEARAGEAERLLAKQMAEQNEVPNPGWGTNAGDALEQAVKPEGAGGGGWEMVGNGWDAPPEVPDATLAGIGGILSIVAKSAALSTGAAKMTSAPSGAAKALHDQCVTAQNWPAVQHGLLEMARCMNDRRVSVANSPVKMTMAMLNLVTDMVVGSMTTVGAREGGTELVNRTLDEVDACVKRGGAPLGPYLVANPYVAAAVEVMTRNEVAILHHARAASENVVVIAATFESALAKARVMGSPSITVEGVEWPMVLSGALESAMAGVIGDNRNTAQQIMSVVNTTNWVAVVTSTDPEAEWQGVVAKYTQACQLVVSNPQELADIKDQSPAVQFVRCLPQIMKDKTVSLNALLLNLLVTFHTEVTKGAAAASDPETAMVMVDGFFRKYTSFTGGSQYAAAVGGTDLTGGGGQLVGNVVAGRTCWKCGDPSHLARDCTQRGQARQGGGGAGGGGNPNPQRGQHPNAEKKTGVKGKNGKMQWYIKCYECGKYGHRAKDCPGQDGDAKGAQGAYSVTDMGAMWQSMTQFMEQYQANLAVEAARKEEEAKQG